MARQMIRVARQRYKMIPKLDAADKPVVTPVMKSDGVTPRTTRAGKPIVRKVTVADKSQPLDLKCERCRRVIIPGEKYRKVAIKQTYGGIRRVRCIDCPGWQPWELSSSLASRIMEIQNENVDGSDWQGSEDAESRASEIAEMIRELAQEKQEAADNMESGFGHATEQSEAIAEQAQNLDSWADEVEQSGTSVDFPEGKCGNCNGEQMECSTHEEKDHDTECDGTEECMECNGSGEGDDVPEEELDTWREEAAQAIRDALEAAPDA